MSLFRNASDERRFREDFIKFARSLPPGASKVRFVVRCTMCDKRWERKLDLRDKQMPAALADCRREGLIHEHLYEHTPLEAHFERLT